MTFRTQYGMGSDKATTWRDLAACVDADPEIFYPIHGRVTLEAKSVCDACLVKDACAVDAIENGDPWGIHGGMAEEGLRQYAIQHGLRFGPRISAVSQRQSHRKAVSVP